MIRIIICATVLLLSVECHWFACHGSKCVRPPKDCSQKPMSDKQKRKCALTSGRKQLLAARNDNWEWDEPLVAEAIIAIQLSKPNWYSKKKANTDITVKQMYLNLLSVISIDDDLSSETWSRGKLAYYLMAMLSVCKEPREFYGHNIVNILQNHLVISSTYLNTNKFAYALIVLALCKAKQPVADKYMKGISSPGGQYTFKVDEAAMVYMAYHCVNDPAYSDQQAAALDYILSEQEKNGLWSNSNVITTAKAVQVIFATGNSSLESRTKKAMRFLVKSIDASKNTYSARILSVLTPLAKKSFLNIGEHCPEIPVTTTPSTPTFGINIRVVNNLTADFDQTWSVSIHEGQSLIKAMENLQAADTSFSFTSKPTTWGQFLVSVCNMTALTDDRQYWQILDKNGIPSQTGASNTFPSDGDGYTLKLTTW